MSSEVKVKIYETGGRFLINLSKYLVMDSMFPFEVGQELIARIDGDRIVIVGENKQDKKKV